MFKFFKRHRPQPPDATPKAVEQDPRSPIELYESSGKSLSDAPPRTQQVLGLAEQSHRDQQSRRDIESRHPAREENANKPEPPQPNAPDFTGNDDAALAMLAGAQFGPNASMILPSGKTIDTKEAQTWTDLYRKSAE